MLKLLYTEEHVKNYRPQILAMTGNPIVRPQMLDIVKSITKQKGLTLLGHVVYVRRMVQGAGITTILHLFSASTRLVLLQVPENLAPGGVQLVALSPGQGLLLPGCSEQPEGRVADPVAGCRFGQVGAKHGRLWVQTRLDPRIA